MVIKTTFFILMLMFSLGCTSSRWVVDSNYASDPDTYRVIQSSYGVELSTLASPTTGVSLNFQLTKINQGIVNERLKVRRHIQSYRPRWEWLALGASASAYLFYIANFAEIDQPNQVADQQILLNLLSLGSLGIGLYQHKPVGSPKITNETALLATVGERTVIDTLQVNESTRDIAIINLFFNNRYILQNVETTFKDGSISLDITDALETVQLRDKSNGELIVDMTFQDVVYEFFISPEELFIPYARSKEIVSLYNKPVYSSANILTTMPENALFPLENTEEFGFYGVQFGAITAFIPKAKSDLIWSVPGKSYTESLSDYLKLERMRQSEIEVNIPVTNRAVGNHKALILVNKYPYSEQATNDDISVWREYLTVTFGYSEESIITRFETSIPELRSLVSSINEEGVLNEVTVFINGEGKNGRINIADTSSNYSSIDHVLTELSKIKSQRFRFLLDIDHEQEIIGYPNTLIESEIQRFAQTELFPASPESFIWMSSKIGQSSGRYQGKLSKSFSMFTFYLLQGIKLGYNKTADLIQYVNRELNFSSRRLYDRPQQSVLISSQNIPLLD